MPAIRLPAEVETHLEALAQATGRTKTFYARQAILEHLGDLEDWRREQFSASPDQLLASFLPQQQDVFSLRPCARCAAAVGARMDVPGLCPHHDRDLIFVFRFV